MTDQNELYKSLREMMWKAEEFRQSLKTTGLAKMEEDRMSEHIAAIMNQMYEMDDTFKELIIERNAFN